MKIYLAHPITSGGPSTLAIKREILSFMEKWLPSLEVIDPSDYELDDMLQSEAIVLRNKSDILRSCAVIADLTIPSVGVAAECMFSKLNNIPVIALIGQGKVSAWVYHLADMTSSTPEGVVMALKMKLKV